MFAVEFQYNLMVTVEKFSFHLSRDLGSVVDINPSEHGAKLCPAWEPSSNDRKSARPVFGRAWVLLLSGTQIFSVHARVIFHISSRA